MLKKLWHNLKEWKEELAGILLALLLFLVSPFLLRLLDPTAGAYDAGVLHIIVFSLVALLTFSFLAWVGIKLNFKEVFDYLQTDFTKDFATLDKWQKTKISLLLYFFYLLLFVLIAKAL